MYIRTYVHMCMYVQSMNQNPLIHNELQDSVHCLSTLYMYGTSVSSVVSLR